MKGRRGKLAKRGLTYLTPSPILPYFTLHYTVAHSPIFYPTIKLQKGKENKQW